MNENSLKKFQELLRTLFQFDYVNLDFGIYRILNYKRRQIEEFIAERLPRIVEEAFSRYAETERKDTEKEVQRLRDEAKKTFGIEAIGQQGQLKFVFHDTPLGKEYLQAIERAKSVQVAEELKSRAYNDLYMFFSRYYEDGDFVSKRRYGRHETYAIPYNGEEVVLYWANRDQYYAKTGDRFKAYRFKVGDFTVAFELRNLVPEQNNNTGKKRYFVLAHEDPVTWSDGEKALVVAFEYRPLSEVEEKDHGRTEQQKPQESLNEAAEQAILAQVTQPGLKAALARMEKRNDKEKSVLRWRLDHFTRRNTMDFFVHKGLRGFLLRELDFFIKNEVLLLDELIGGVEEDLREHLQRGRVVRQVAEAIIDFLAQVEDFQKKLWEKKKFVVRTEYCLTLDRLPEELWDEVLANQAQIAEWRQLYSTDGKVNKSFLKAHPTLVVDTRHFPEEFKWRLLASFEDLDEALDGLLIKSENWQALNLLLEKYREKVKCIYIDPPYNTGSDEFIYKDRYQHSSWLSMMADRLALGRDLMRQDGAMFLSIDAHERDRLKNVADLIFSEDGYLNTFVWINNLKGRQISGRGAAGTHEYVLAYGNADVGRFSISVSRAKNIMPNAYKGFDYEVRHDDAGTYVLKNELYNTNSKFNEDTRPNLVFNIHWKPETGEIKFSEIDEDVEFDGFLRIPPKENNDGVHRYHAWRWNKEKISRESHDLEFVTSGDSVRIFTKVRGFQSTVLKDVITDITTDSGSQDLSDCLATASFSNYPKPVGLVEVFAGLADDNELVLDYFAGSGTTAHAVINLNRQDGGRRKYILVEMGDWFQTVILPRIKKVVFCEKWKDGKPVGTNGTSHLLKYQYLEQYEDTLNNLELPREVEGQKALEMFGDEYLLKYMLDFETQGSPCLLNLDMFKDPFAYRLKVLEGDEIVERPVDLAETFNYLLGIQVRKVRAFQDNGRPYRAVLGEKNGKRVAIVWRSVVGLEDNEEALMKDKAYIEQTVLPSLLGEAKPDLLLVNGACFVKDAEAIEPEFKRLMFAPVGA
jgi:adenine-specific DNA-methyltransferase